MAVEGQKQLHNSLAGAEMAQAPQPSANPSPQECQEWDSHGHSGFQGRRKLTLHVGVSCDRSRAHPGSLLIRAAEGWDGLMQ